MPLRRLLSYLINNEQIIQKLAESYPIRRAAQLTAYFLHKGREIGEEGYEKLKESDAVNRIQEQARQTGQKAQQTANKSLDRTSGFLTRFSKYLDEEWQEAAKKIEQQKRMEEQKKRNRDR